VRAQLDLCELYGISRITARRLKGHTGLADTGAEAVPYSHNLELPPSVRSHLPEHAQDIYREAFNHAFAAHMDDPRQEEAAHRIAWAAVKRRYVKEGDAWLKRD
jgi:cation transport regulator